jgi:hypothetical protein
MITHDHKEKKKYKKYPHKKPARAHKYLKKKKKNRVTAMCQSPDLLPSSNSTAKVIRKNN